MTKFRATGRCSLTAFALLLAIGMMPGGVAAAPGGHLGPPPWHNGPPTKLPEPSSLSLVVGGLAFLAGLAIVRRRRRRSSSRKEAAH
jgi:hypothetical protein